MTFLPALILSGGTSRRFGGRDKAFQMLGGKPLIVHVIDRLANQVDVLAINAPDAAPYRTLGLPLVADDRAAGLGPLSGILAGLDWAAELPERPTHLLTVPCDTPFLPATLATQLLEGGGPATAAIAASGGRQHYVCAIWPVSGREILAHGLASGQLRSVRDWLAIQPVAVVEFIQDTKIPPFFNVNSAENLADAIGFLRP